MNKAIEFKIIIQDIQHQLTCLNDTSLELQKELLLFIFNQLAAEFNTKEFTLRDRENAHYMLDDIVQFNISPIFVSVPHRRDIQTYSEIDKNRVSIRYIYSDNQLQIIKFNFMTDTDESSFYSIQQIQKLNYQGELEFSTLSSPKSRNSIIKQDNMNFEVNIRNVLKQQLKNIDVEDDDEIKLVTNSIDTSQNKNDVISIGKPTPFEEFQKGGENYTNHNDKLSQDSQSPRFGPSKTQSPAYLPSFQNSRSRGASTDSVSAKSAQGLNKSDSFIIDGTKKSENTQSPCLTPKSANSNLKIYTLEELAEHKSYNDAWIAIHGKVYDVTEYLDVHPGGGQFVMQGVGTDATELFEEAHKYVNAHYLLGDFHIGFLKISK